MRIVLDINVLVSGLLWRGLPNQILKQIEQKKYVLILSPEIVEELEEILSRPKFLARISLIKSSPGELIESLLSVIELVQDIHIDPVIEDDPDDDKILSCAFAARADLIISGDRHLLKCKNYRGIRIISPEEFIHNFSS